MNTKSSRRSFLKSAGMTAAAAGFPTIIPASARGKDGAVAPSNRITLATIGTGNQGIGEMRRFLWDKRCQYVAVCDVNKRSDGYWSNKPGGRDVARDVCVNFYKGNKNRGDWKGIDAYADFRDVLARKDIDAVHIATPDHWHAIPVIEAAKAKKHIYGQKPLSLTIAEGRAMSDAVKKMEVVFQTGSQQRSDNRFRYAAELVRQGAIGKVNKTTCYLPAGNRDYSGQGHRQAVEPVPAGFDYEMWLGPAPWAEYAPARCHVNFRWIYDYSGGQITDWGGHHPDIAQMALGTELTGPVAIKNARGVLPPRDALWNTAESYHFEAHYADGRVLVIQSSPTKNGIQFEGSEGSLWVSRHDMSASDKKLLNPKRTANNWKDSVKIHFANFLDCIASGQATNAPCENAHRSITISHLGNIAIQLGRDLEWDPQLEQINNDFAANAMVDRPYRSPWKLPRV